MPTRRRSRHLAEVRCAVFAAAIACLPTWIAAEADPIPEDGGSEIDVYHLSKNEILPDFYSASICVGEFCYAPTVNEIQYRSTGVTLQVTPPTQMSMEEALTIIQEKVAPAILEGMPQDGTVKYRGTLINGQEFDSSYRDGKPATFRVDELISGWGEALQLMKEGGKWQLYIPPQLAFRRGSPLEHRTILYEVELVSVN